MMQWCQLSAVHTESDRCNNNYNDNNVSTHTDERCRSVNISSEPAQQHVPAVSRRTDTDDHCTPETSKLSKDEEFKESNPRPNRQ